ncbi:uncharacterized protein FA14DRAFT_23363 [Meira miltonrushii]|uniref:Secreted protein n=1 Tax=Meira miltonrushii TaxID=1280837 RepID=A0A316VKQ4_9BASI|nr:uncharacterized protein FA14DRAFT_23363 [Meira miltonrushii]PWN38136.1 hypothetical protein FA14DRAFT_23363 [Meira miltonrushii]
MPVGKFYLTILTMMAFMVLSVASRGATVGDVPQERDLSTNGPTRTAKWMSRSQPVQPRAPKDSPGYSTPQDGPP